MSRAESSDKVEGLYFTLKERIASGAWSIGEQMPTELALAREFDCNRTTISKALTRLAHDHLVERRRRTGTRVIRREATAAPEKAALQLDACAFIYPSDEHEGIWQTARGFQRAAHASDRRSILLTTGLDARKEAEIIERLGEFDVKGAVLYPVATDPEMELHYRQMILACPFPVVLVELNFPGAQRPSVVSDGLHAGYTMTRYLIEQKATRIGFVTNYASASYLRDRYLGYRQAMNEAGLGEGFAHLEPSMHPDFTDPLRENAAVARVFLEKYPDVEAVVATTDFMAWGVIRAARELGRRVPEDLKVVGIDDYQQHAHDTLPLTTYHIPYTEMGRQAFLQLNQILNGQSPDAQETQLRGHLIVRQSA